MNNIVMNLSNNYENLITSTMSFNWLKGRLHFFLYNPPFANRRRNCYSLTVVRFEQQFHLCKLLDDVLVSPAIFT